MDYTIAAIPTLYRGRQYRSRLEARWAAFFDQIGWKHEYEPFDLGEWSPDFGVEIPFAGLWLAEVKPIGEFSTKTGTRMVKAANKRARAGLEFSGIFLCGTSPRFESYAACIGDFNFRSRSGFEGWHKQYLVCVPGRGVTTIEPPDFDNAKKVGLDLCPRRMAHAWATATNEVQWHGAGA